MAKRTPSAYSAVIAVASPVTAQCAMPNRTSTTTTTILRSRSEADLKNVAANSDDDGDGGGYDDVVDGRDEDDRELLPPPRKTRRQHPSSQSNIMDATVRNSSASSSSRRRLDTQPCTAGIPSSGDVAFLVTRMRSHVLSLTSRYFDVVISKANAPVVCAFAGKIKGKAIYADTDIEQASRIWTETPFVAMQHEKNRDKMRCCQHCFVPLLSEYKALWEDMAARWNASANRPQHEPPVGDDELDLALQQLQVDRKNCGLAGSTVKCLCGEVYCSKLCQIRAYHQYHSILCPRDDAYSAMNQFLTHMRHTNDIFLLVAKVIARVLSRFLATKDIVKAREPMDMFYKKPWWEVVMMEKQVQCAGDTDFPTAHMEIASWDEDSAPRSLQQHQQRGSSALANGMNSPLQGKRIPAQAESKATRPHFPIEDQEEIHVNLDEMDLGDHDGLQAQCLRELLTCTHQLLLDAIECNLVHLEREDQLHGLSVDGIWTSCASILSFEFFAAQLGLFEMNNISLEIDHPFRGLIEILDPEVHTEGDAPVVDENPLVSRVRRVLEHEEAFLGQRQFQESKDHSSGASDSNDTGGFLGVEGTALFPIICTMNHSCEPNCTVLYTKDGNAHVVAVRNICKGEELCICYIDIDEDVATREANLREYQFKCFCARCSEERRQFEHTQPSSDSPSAPPQPRSAGNNASAGPRAGTPRTAAVDPHSTMTSWQ